MTDLLDLAARVEAAAGPDPRLDCLIENALGLAKFERDPHMGYGDADYNRIDPKPFTASLDAAMMLVPEGYDWMLGRTNSGLTIHAEVGGRGEDYMVFGATPPLALTAACLRAHHAIQEADHG